MVVRSAHNELNTKLGQPIKKAMNPVDAEIISYVMFQDMEYGGARSSQDMRVQSLIRRYNNLARGLGQDRLSLDQAIDKALKVSGFSSDVVESAHKKKLVLPLYAIACVCVLEKFSPAVCRQCFSYLEQAVKTIKQPTLLDKLYNRDL